MKVLHFWWISEESEKKTDTCTSTLEEGTFAGVHITNICVYVYRYMYGKYKNQDTCPNEEYPFYFLPFRNLYLSEDKNY